MPHSELRVDNCLIVGHGVQQGLTHAEPMKAVLNRNTFLGTHSTTVSLFPGKKIDPPLGEKAPRPIQVETSANIFGGPVKFAQYPFYLAKEKPLSADEAVRLLTQLVGWRESQNLYLVPEDSDLLWLTMEAPPGQFNRLSPTVPVRTLADWKSFWGLAELDSQRGKARFQGGDLVAKASRTPEQVTPADFRLRPDSAGYRAGKDGKDLGADVDLVGPGPGYEKWQKTPEYQQWLRETGQVNTQAFLLLGAKGEVGKYDTLADAVERASDGDTIEVRGNGPFVSQPIEIRKNALVIRAGEGYRPVIRLSPEGAQANAPLLTTFAPLVLEGLELQRESPPKTPANVQHFVLSGKASLHVANCRFVVPRLTCIWVVDSPHCVVRNCEFLGIDAVALGGRHPPAGGSWILDNCVSATGSTLYYFYQHRDLRDASIQFTRNSAVAKFGVRLFVTRMPTFPEAGPAVQPSRLEISESLLNADKVLRFNQPQPPPLPFAEAETLLARLLNWQGRGNLYGNNLLEWCVGGKPMPPHGPQSLAEWKEFWKSSETGSLQGQVRFRGGDLLSRVATAPENITPADFRLRADSAGYRAGKNKQDLGADVGLVGPGPAYQRWKKTPEYQEWLKDAEQAVARKP
jgi:hypothetical protein